MPRKSHPDAKLQAETPLTPARSFRDEDLVAVRDRIELSTFRFQGGVHSRT
jgi:hypothetical protein